MPRKPKDSPDEHCSDPQPGEKDRGYYYDDSYGYENYDPDTDDDDPPAPIKNRAISDGPVH